MSAAPSPPSTSASREDARALRWALGLALASFVLRLAWIAEASGLPWFELAETDDYVFREGARRIAAGDWLLEGEDLRFGPAYFYFLALVRLVLGDGPFAPRLLQAVGGAFAVLLAWDAARRVVSPREALVAAGLAAFYGPTIFFDAQLLPETGMILCHALFLAACARGLTGPRAALGPWLVAGAAIGVSVTLRPNAALVALVGLAAALLPRGEEPRRDRARRAAAFVLATSLAVAPILVRSTLATGSPALAGTAGLNLFIGNGPGATGVLRVPPEVPLADSPGAQFVAFEAEAERATGRDLTLAEVDAYWIDRTLDHVLAHPVDATWLLLRKVRLAWNAREISIVVSYDFCREIAPVLTPLVGFGVLGPLAMVGVGSALARRRRIVLPSDAERDATRVARLVAVLSVIGTLGIAVFFMGDRYRVPLVPFAVVAAAVGVRELVEIAGRRADRRASVVAVGALVLGLALALPPVRVRDRHLDDWAHLAVGYELLGRWDEAASAWDEVLTRAPGHVAALGGLARVADGRGGGSAAVEAWTAVRDAARAAGDAEALEAAERRLDALHDTGL